MSIKHSLRATGLLAAVALLMAAAPAVAQAKKFQAEVYPASIHGVQEGINKFTVEGAPAVECETAEFNGTLTEASEWLKITPTYGKCKAFGFASTVTFNGCQYEFHTNGSVDVLCPSGKKIVIEVTEGLAKGCKVEIGEQKGLESVKYENIAGGKVRVTANVKHVAYRSNEVGFGCPANGKEATYEGKVVAEGKNELGEPDSIKVE